MIAKVWGVGAAVENQIDVGLLLAIQPTKLDLLNFQLFLIPN